MHYALRDLVLCDQETLTKYFRGVEECFRKWVDSFIISQVNAALKQMNPPLFTTPNGSCTSIYNAFACGINVYLNAHSDKDFTFCAVSIHTRQEYHLMGDKILAYFVFPTMGIAVPLRQGDQLLFDPDVPHMVSSQYNNEDEIYCVSLYLKSNVLGKNDNSLPLTLEEKRLSEPFH